MPLQADGELGDLHVNRKRLYQMAKNYEEPLPRDCPCEFKIGRTPDTSLSHQEKEDIPAFCEVSRENGYSTFCRASGTSNSSQA